MFRGQQVLLRAVERSDLDQLWRWHVDVEVWQKVQSGPPVPVSFADFEARWEERVAEPNADDLEFAVEADGRLIGRCALFDVDHLARRASIGLTIGDPADRGKGYGRDIVRTLVDYAFRHRNLNKVELSTLVTNEAGRRAYEAAGFVEEGRKRHHAFVNGEYVDELFMSVLREEWEKAR